MFQIRTVDERKLLKKAWAKSPMISGYDLKIDSVGRLRTNLYNKRDDFNFPVVNIPFICSNIPAAPAYEISISQLML
jgi:hypothetical protein